MESKEINDQKKCPLLVCRGDRDCYLHYSGGGARHVIGKGGHVVQCIQALSRMLIGVVDQLNGNSLVQIYGRCEGWIIVQHFLVCLQEKGGGSMVFWVCLSGHWLIQLDG